MKWPLALVRSFYLFIYLYQIPTCLSQNIPIWKKIHTTIGNQYKNCIEFPQHFKKCVMKLRKKKFKNKQSTLHVYSEPQRIVFYINTQYYFNELFIIQFVFSFVSKNLSNELTTQVLNTVFTKIFKLKVKYSTCETT